MYGHDAETREQALHAGHNACSFIKQHSGPVIERLVGWKRSSPSISRKPNSGLGKAITYLLRHWFVCQATFLRAAGAIWITTSRKGTWRAVLHRKNALFYRTLNGAQVGDIFMSLIHTCQLCGANSFEYLTELQRHARELAANPAEWILPWNYPPDAGTAWIMMNPAWPKRIDSGQGW